MYPRYVKGFRFFQDIEIANRLLKIAVEYDVRGWPDMANLMLEKAETVEIEAHETEQNRKNALKERAEQSRL